MSAALAEPAGNENAIDPFQAIEGVVILKNFGVDPFYVDPNIIGDAAMRQSFC